MALAYHEPREQLPPLVIDQHRAIESLIEELEAIAWYNQRVAVTPNAELKSVLAHNRDEEIEHASMIMEWLRRNFPGFDEKMRIYLFTTEPITEIEEKVDQTGGTSSASPAATLGIGSLKGA
jgi:ferritin-like protein